MKLTSDDNYQLEYYKKTHLKNLLYYKDVQKIVNCDYLIYYFIHNTNINIILI